MLITLSISGFAQVLSDYIMTTGTDATKWIQLTDSTNLISGTGDSKASAVTDIGFTFNGYGRSADIRTEADIIQGDSSLIAISNLHNNS